MTSADRLVIRSYQRIFRPDRRIYSVEGHQLPIPGGVPLSWLGTFVASLLAVLVLSGRSLPLSVALALLAAAIGRTLGGLTAAAALGAAVLIGTQLLGLVLGVVDWPLRLIVLPATVATLAGQATPDGRSAHRYVRSWLVVRLRPGRRSLGRSLAPAGARRLVGGLVWTAPDHHGPRLRRGRVTGPATVRFTSPVLVTEGRWRGRRGRTARPAADGAGAVEAVELGYGERLEVRS